MDRALLTILLFPLSLIAQGEYFIFNNITDPYSSYKEKGLYHAHEIGLVSYGKLIKVGVHNFPALEGGWLRLNGTFAYHKVVNDENTISAGINLGYMVRSKSVYPYFGLESEYIKHFGNWGIGLRSNYDRRTDFQYWGGKPKWRYSGQILIQHKF